MQFTAVLSMRKDSVAAAKMSLFRPGLFGACAPVLVQTDAWDRYGERATLCFALSRPGQGQTARVENARRAAAPTVYRRGSAAKAKPVL